MKKLDTMESWKEDLNNLKKHVANKEKSGMSGSKNDDADSGYFQNNRRPFHKIDFPTFSGGDPRGWVLKAEKYFRFYNTSEDEKVDIAAMHLEDDPLDLFSWLSSEQNPDEYLISVRQTGSVQEYRQEFARRSARVSSWPDHCLLKVFVHSLKEELKSDVRIHKPHTVYKAMSLALEFESKLSHTRTQKPSNTTSKPEAKPFTSQPYSSSNPTKAEPKPSPRITNPEKQARFLHGECFSVWGKVWSWAPL
ncbi:hypothetical protein E3N88_25713 [Mikania micrantha]|uniref:Retrotransposon gag domain-containing protein n=1 Tax=Mikania micrantha TaxID=192012 RepID=A0A5N6N5I1_9ASTR|nr:hypothetical protein E3N88_25713 [Mikania micrantha]